MLALFMQSAIAQAACCLTWFQHKALAVINLVTLRSTEACHTWFQHKGLAVISFVTLRSPEACAASAGDGDAHHQHLCDAIA